MGDPGLPVMAGVLAVPIGVLVFVLLLTMMGRRWVLAGPPDILVAGDEAAYEEAGIEAAPAAGSIDPEPSRYGPSAAYDPYGSPVQGPYGSPRDGHGPVGDAYGSARPGTYGSAHEALEAPRPDPYTAPTRERYTPPPGPSRVSEWAPYVPAPRRSQEGSSWSSYGSTAEPYASSPGDPYGSAGNSSYGTPPAYDGYGYGGPTARDRSDRRAYDGSRYEPEDPQSFPYGPYG